MCSSIVVTVLGVSRGVGFLSVPFPDVLRQSDQAWHFGGERFQRNAIWPVAQCRIRVRVHLEEETVEPHCQGRAGERYGKRTIPGRVSASSARLLNTVGGIEHYRYPDAVQDRY